MVVLKGNTKGHTTNSQDRVGPMIAWWLTRLRQACMLLSFLPRPQITQFWGWILVFCSGSRIGRTCASYCVDDVSWYIPTLNKKQKGSTVNSEKKEWAWSKKWRGRRRIRSGRRNCPLNTHMTGSYSQAVLIPHVQTNSNVPLQLPPLSTIVPVVQHELNGARHNNHNPAYHIILCPPGATLSLWMIDMHPCIP